MNKTKDFGTPPTEASENLRSIEVDKRTLRKTGRVHQFNTSVSEEWMAKLKTISYEERLKYVEVLERALECYEKHRERENTKTETRNISQPITKIPVNNYSEPEITQFCSFEEENSSEICQKPIFDKKKWLCRSHNRQVWKRFNEFTKDMSVSSTATWLKTWEQSGDWQYFWNLGKEKNK